jgi:hypothetical protein
MEEKLKTINSPSPETAARQSTNEMVDVQKRAEDHKIPKEIESWLEKIEKDPTQQTVVNDTNGQPLLQLPATDPRIKLPTTRAKFADGFKKTVADAGRWLSVFIFRLIKIKAGKVKFEDE